MAAADRARLAVAVAVASIAGATTGLAFAQDPAANRSLAETLFQDARRLMSEKRYAEACPKLSESQRLDPATGTLLNLAVCHAEEGKLASASVEFTDALADAHRDARPDREQFAREHLAAIQSRISHVTIVVPDIARVAGLQIKLDGSLIGPAAWGLPAPMDPGAHEVTASAPGRRAWTKGFVIAGDAQNQQVDVPLLGAVAPPPVAASGTGTSVTAGPSPPVLPAAQAAAVAAPAPEVTTGADTSGRLRTTSYVVAGAGVAALGVGAAFGLRAFSKWSDRNKNCPSSVCNDMAVSDASAAKTAALVSDITVGVGLAAVVTGAILWYRSRPTEGSATASLSLSPSVSSHAGALVLDGHW